MKERATAKMWFAPKPFGFGASVPISWEGWTLVAAYLAALVGVRWFAVAYFAGTDRLLVHLAGAAILTGALFAVARAKTEGGWRWRG